ncbi:MAG: hypothetical protein IJU62_09830 [Muribaculaceae bacterium]|nr:hypothetical protein [Muribaculaceae bacterium]
MAIAAVLVKLHARINSIVLTTKQNNNQMKKTILLLLLLSVGFCVNAKQPYTLRFQQRDWHLWFTFDQPKDGEQTPGWDIVVFFDGNDNPYYYQEELDGKKTSIRRNYGELSYLRSKDGIDYYQVSMPFEMYKLTLGIHKNRKQVTLIGEEDMSAVLGQGEKSVSIVNGYRD